MNMKPLDTGIERVNTITNINTLMKDQLYSNSTTVKHFFNVPMTSLMVAVELQVIKYV
jgi:hypothetical protein